MFFEKGKQAAEIDRHSLFTDKQKSTMDRLVWAIDYMPSINRVRHAVLKHWHLHWHLLQDVPGCNLLIAVQELGVFTVVSHLYLNQAWPESPRKNNMLHIHGGERK